jgi:hypothetical protein
MAGGAYSGGGGEAVKVLVDGEGPERVAHHAFDLATYVVQVAQARPILRVAGSRAERLAGTTAHGVLHLLENLHLGQDEVELGVLFFSVLLEFPLIYCFVDRNIKISQNVFDATSAGPEGQTDFSCYSDVFSRGPDWLSCWENGNIGFSELTCLSGLIKFGPLVETDLWCLCYLCRRNKHHSFH